MFNEAGAILCTPLPSQGLQKRDLARELLTLFALNLRLQRLYVELKEMLDQCQQQSAPPVNGAE